MSKRISLTQWAGLTKEEYRALTAAEREKLKEDRARSETKTWRPEASDLALAHIPEGDRERIRKRLSPWLLNLTDTSGRRIRVKGGDCWHVAQALVFTANDPNVKYVEGVWTRGDELRDANSKPPCPHAWAMVDGYRVDLVEEFFRWNSFGGDADWFHEPLTVFSRDQLFDYFDFIEWLQSEAPDKDLSKAEAISTCWPPEVFQVALPEEVHEKFDFLFGPAIKRLQERYARENAEVTA